MALLIDGYNLLHVTGIFGKGRGPGSFQRSREALLRFLAASIDFQRHRDTTIVFDAADAPPDLPDTIEHEGLVVRYARNYPDADTLIEELIAQHSTPRKLLVVSSDHRIQRAARRRRARSIDSDVWYSKVWQHRNRRHNHGQGPGPEKPVGELSQNDVDYWVDKFTDEQSDDLDQPKSNLDLSTEAEKDRSLENPFPPGYGEDLL